MKLKILAVVISCICFFNVVEAKYYKLKPELDIEKLELEIYRKENDYRMKEAQGMKSAVEAYAAWQTALGTYSKALNDIEKFENLYSKVRRTLKSGAPNSKLLMNKLIKKYLIETDDTGKGSIHL
ncbi:MAG: hypothetical protein LBB37_03500 [Endomicrobium sp.]|jgi:hypothetical protein|nr:hypothetical protein [Endomicrobium sp.]